jgi:Heterokaryon incompatibility protein (HET)
MRLINVEALQFQEFTGLPREPYVILSHTWESDEPNYQETRDKLRKLGTLTHYQRFGPDFKRYWKVVEICRLAREKGLRYAWIDSCCINKEDVRETETSIRSMYKWYENAHVCIVILSDVSRRAVAREKKSRWFKRLWTLQELLAPKDVEFYCKGEDSTPLVYIGTKVGLSSYITSCTGIPVDALLNKHPLGSYSAAQKMSWAASRKATVEEDIAYGLLGIFDVSMRVEYGEGLERAFHRLQKEILAEHNDMTVLGWSSDTPLRHNDSLLAPSPKVFAERGQDMRPSGWGHHRVAFDSWGLRVEGTTRLRFAEIPKQTTFGGLPHIQSKAVSWTMKDRDRRAHMRYVLFVGQRDQSDGQSLALGICLQKLKPGVFQRDLDMPLVYTRSAFAEPIKHGSYHIQISKVSVEQPSLSLLFLDHSSVQITGVWPCHEWDHAKRRVFVPELVDQLSSLSIKVATSVWGGVQQLTCHALCDFRETPFRCILLEPFGRVASVLKDLQSGSRENATWDELERRAPEVKLLGPSLTAWHPMRLAPGYMLTIFPEPSRSAVFFCTYQVVWSAGVPAVYPLSEQIPPDPAADSPPNPGAIAFARQDVVNVQRNRGARLLDRALEVTAASTGEDRPANSPPWQYQHPLPPPLRSWGVPANPLPFATSGIPAYPLLLPASPFVPASPWG